MWQANRPRANPRWLLFEFMAFSLASFILGGIFLVDNWPNSAVCCWRCASPPPPPSSLLLPPPTRACHLWASGDLILASTGSVNKGLVFILSSYSSRPFITPVILSPPAWQTHTYLSHPPTQKPHHRWNIFLHLYLTVAHNLLLLMSPFPCQIILAKLTEGNRIFFISKCDNKKKKWCDYANSFMKLDTPFLQP